MKISDEQLSNWTSPWFNKEVEMAEKTKESVKTAISNHSVLKNLKIRVFAKGSYPNNTNVRKDSDIDIAVELQKLIVVDYFDGITDDETGLRNYTGISRQLFKSHVGEALEKEFGIYKIDRTGNKVFRIRGSDKTKDSDIIPCTTYRRYYKWGYRKGIKLILNQPDGKYNVNYPDKHLENGADKNTSTKKRFKSVVRILKNANNYRVERENAQDYPSFMIECLAYNIDKSTYLATDPWRDILNNLCTEAREYLKLDESQVTNRWREVNNYKYLFQEDQIWTRSDAGRFVKEIYGLMGS